MKFFYSPLSPFARKCRVVILEKGLGEKVELITAMPLESPRELLTVNPLSRVPALLFDDGTSLCESSVICEYLDSLAPGKPLLPVDKKQRFEVLRIAAFADGIMDASVCCVLESRRPEDKRYADWVLRKETSIARTIAVIAAHHFDANAPLDMAIINTVVALNYVSFRQPHIYWREAHPALTTWYDELSKRPSFSSTAPLAA